MPYPQHANILVNDDGARQALTDFDMQVQKYLEAQHKDDGSHGAVTADSVAISGTLTVSGQTTLLQALMQDLFVTGTLHVGLLTGGTYDFVVTPDFVSPGVNVDNNSGGYLRFRNGGTTMLEILASGLVRAKGSAGFQVQGNLENLAFFTGDSDGGPIGAYVKNTIGSANPGTLSRFSIGQRNDEGNAMLLQFDHNVLDALVLNQNASGILRLETASGHGILIQSDGSVQLWNGATDDLTVDTGGGTSSITLHFVAGVYTGFS